jgi:hypothetical protein
MTLFSGAYVSLLEKIRKLSRGIKENLVPANDSYEYFLLEPFHNPRKSSENQQEKGIKNRAEPCKMKLSSNKNKKALVMKTITEITGEAQGLLNIPYQL